MKLMRYGRTCVIGAVLVTGAFLTGRAGLGGVAAEPTPMEAVFASAAQVPVSVGGGPGGEGQPWDITQAKNARVEYWIDFLRGRNRRRTELWLERLGRYGPYIRGRLRARGMPEDLVYLALIESGLSPVARSHAAAVGMWQFIAETGRRYGLRINRYVDERRDPIRATEAALDYLQKLYRQFGSWYLAAAAYNSGEGRVERALRRYAGGRRGDDALFWRIDQHLPRETRNYVPLMLAAAHIAKDPAKYGFHGLDYQEPLAFETVRVPGATSLRAVARAAGVEERMVRELNPHLLRGVTPPGRAWPVRVPVGRSEVFARNFGRRGEEERLATVEHTVRRGETLSHIARRYGTTVRELRAANGWLNPRRLRVGQRLRVPSSAGAVTMSAEAGGWRVHRVRRGDSLWEISRRYGVTVRQLQLWNGLGRRSKIVPGQELRIRI
ncbi:MAG TPA: LysM peptidoglycan-binding domain-containing protein [Longimicrobiales bacterium]